MIGIYQPHNQNIAVMNAYRRTIGLTEDKYLSFFHYFLTYKEDITRVFWLPNYKWG